MKRQKTNTNKLVNQQYRPEKRQPFLPCTG